MILTGLIFLQKKELSPNSILMMKENVYKY